MASELLKALGMAGGTLGAGAALHGAGLGSLLSPLDYPRQALYNAFASPMRALESGNASDLLGAIPGLAGAGLGLAVGGPLGILAGSALGGALQGGGLATGRQEFAAPSVEDVTGTDDFLPNMLVGMATDPLTYAGASQTWKLGRSAVNSMTEKAAQEANTVIAPNQLYRPEDRQLNKMMQRAAVRPEHIPEYTILDNGEMVSHIPPGAMTMEEMRRLSRTTRADLQKNRLLTPQHHVDPTPEINIPAETMNLLKSLTQGPRGA